MKYKLLILIFIISNQSQNVISSEADNAKIDWSHISSEQRKIANLIDDNNLNKLEAELKNQNSDKQFALEYATDNNKIDAVKLILERHPNHIGDALFHAAARNLPAIFRLISESPNLKPDELSIETSLEKATNNNNLDLVKYILNRYPSYVSEKEIQRSLNKAVENNNLELVKYIAIKYPATSSSKQLISIAKQAKHPEIEKFLNDFRKYNNFKKKHRYEQSVVTKEDLNKAHADIGEFLGRDLAGLTGTHLYLTFDDYLKNYLESDNDEEKNERSKRFKVNLEDLSVNEIE